MARAPETLLVDGLVRNGFELVREAFVENFTLRGELGAACCIYQDGERVVDLRGGGRDRRSSEPWRADTMVVVHSATKGLAAMVMALAQSRGLLDYDERVCTYWPEFARAGKERVTVRQLLAHQAGLFAFDEPVDREVIADLDRLAAIMVRQAPAWEPGERQAYHAISLGFYESELVRRIDPGHRSLGRFFADEIAVRSASIYTLGSRSRGVTASAARASKPLEATDRDGGAAHARGREPTLDPVPTLVANPGTGFYVDRRRMVVRNLEVPSGGGVGTARSIAKAYGEFAAGGRELGLGRDTLEALMAPAIRRATASSTSVFEGPLGSRSAS